MASRRNPTPVERARRRIGEMHRRVLGPEGPAGPVGGEPRESRGRFYLRFRRPPGGLRGAAIRYLFYGLAGWVVFLLLFGDTGLVRLLRLRHDEKAAAQRIRDLNEEIARLEENVHRLKTDYFAIEKVAREEYGYVYEGEEVFRIVEPPPGDGLPSE
jgi:cell division protein FtsB